MTMADYDLPADLLQLKRDYLAADARCQEVSAALPSAVSVLAMEMEPDPAGHAELVEARAERLRLVEEINRHPWWGTVEHRHDAWMHLLKAAQG